MASKAYLDAEMAINKAYRAGSNERKALTKFVTEGINVNEDRESARWAVKAWSGVLQAMKQTWGLS